MLYIFEDNGEKALSKLFKSAYPEEVVKRFIFAEGNGELEGKVRKNINKTDFIAVFIDIVPDNEHAITIFDELLDMEEYEFKGKLFIMPIICAEYYFIKSIYNSGLRINNRESAELCVSRGFYKNDAEIKSTQDLLKCKNYEKYCKFVRNRSLMSCMQDDRKPKEVYMLSNCRCVEYNSDGCTDETVIDKALKLIQEYDAVPTRSYSTKISSINMSRAREIRRKFIERHNQIVDIYRSTDRDNAGNYVYIRLR